MKVKLVRLRIRGGARYHDAWSARCAFHHWYNPGGRGSSLGFRCCFFPLFVTDMVPGTGTGTGSRIFEPYDGIPCTCTDKCDDPCKGGCGCKACYTSYQDFLSNE